MKGYDYQDSEDYYELALEWINQKDYEKAEIYLRKSMALNINFTYCYITLARLMAKQKRYSDALTIIRKALKVDSAFDRLYYLAAKYAFRMGDFPGAMKYIDRAIKCAPTNLYKKSREIIKRHLNMNK